MFKKSPAFLILILSVAVYAAPLAAQNSATELTHRWAHIKVSGAYPEGPRLPGLFGDITESLDGLITRLDTAADDKRISGVVLELNGTQIGWAKLNEIQQAISRIRDNGKPVYAWMPSGTSMDYLIATACDEIFMPESSTLMLLGLRAEVSFYKDMLEKLDIEADILRVGKFKSAAEPFSRSEMSPEFRQELEMILDDYFDQTVEIVAEHRQLTADQVKSAIDSGPHMASDAVRLGLINRTIYADQIDDAILASQAGGKVKFLEKYGKKKRDNDFSGFAGMMKFMELLTGKATGQDASSQPAIAVIYATGTIVSGESSSGGLGGGNILGSSTFIKAVRKANENDKVKAIVVRVDSPGGSALASDLMWRELELVEKPLIVSMGDVAASGGYYIAMGADKIYAEPGTITGSIGVVGGKLALDGLLQKAGITTTVISRGANSGSLSALHTFSESERKSMTKVLEGVYTQFTSKAADGREMPLEQLQALAQGRIYTGQMAIENGLVDELGTLDDAIDEARKLAGLSEAEPFRKLQLPKPPSPFEQIFGPIDASASTQAQLSHLLEPVLPGVSQQLELLSTISLLSQEHALTVMPFHIRVR